MNNLKKELKKRGIKISWVATKIGVSQPLLSMYLGGKRTIPADVEKKINTLLS
jgi:predicted transcriptional regulator